MVTQTYNEPGIEKTLALGSGSNPYSALDRFGRVETGLYYFRARFYHAELGRFISRDPIGYVDGMSLYRGYFVPGGMDPEGTHTAEDCQEAFIAASIGCILSYNKCMAGAGSGIGIGASITWVLCQTKKTACDTAAAAG